MNLPENGRFTDPDCGPLRFRGVEVDFGSRIVRRDGEAVPLRAKTFDLLLYLLNRRDRVVTKDELLANLWPDASITLDAVVQSVLDLRRTLGDDARNPTFIKTVAKAGYQWIAAPESEAAAPAAAPVAAPVTPSLPAARDGSRRWVAAAAAAVLLAVGAPLLLSKKLFPPQPRGPSWTEVAWWKLNETGAPTVRDSIRGLSAAIPPGVAWTNGVLGGGLLFSRAGAVIRGDDPGVLPAGAAPRTLTAWLKSETTNGDSTILFLSGGPEDDPEHEPFFLLLHENGAAAFGSGHFAMWGTRRIDDGQWHQLVGVFEGAETRRMRLYVDGAEQKMLVRHPQGLARPIPSVWSIGRAVGHGTTFRGSIDDIRVFDRALRPEEIRGLHRCMTGAADVAFEGRQPYFLAPIFGDRTEFLPPEPGEPSAHIRNRGDDFAGAMLVARDPDCAMRSIHGADVGQDLTIEAELRVPRGPNDTITDAGPYFRSRRANPGDGIIGGTSAGYWVHLDSTGRVRVQRLLPFTTLAFSKPPEGFDAGVFHKLEASAHEHTLEVALDGRPVIFEVDGSSKREVELPTGWEAVSPAGRNGGSVGIVFAAPSNRALAGGQEARRIRVAPYRRLAALGETPSAPAATR